MHRAGESHHSRKPSWALEAASFTGPGAGVTSTSAPFQGIPEELTPLATEKYLGGTDDPVKKKDLFLDMLGDLIFGVPSVTVARHHRSESQRLDRRGTPTTPASLSVLPTSQHRHIGGNYQGSGPQGQSHMARDGAPSHFGSTRRQLRRENLHASSLFGRGSQNTPVEERRSGTERRRKLHSKQVATVRCHVSSHVSGLFRASGKGAGVFSLPLPGVMG